MARHLEAGAAAEELAVAYLAAHGLRPVTRNFRSRHGELDLVMTDDGVLVIVEVRYRAAVTIVRPGATVTRPKQRRLVLTTRYLLLRARQYADWPVRFDVLEVTGDLSMPEIRWLKAAFTLDDAVR